MRETVVSCVDTGTCSSDLGFGGAILEKAVDHIVISRFEHRLDTPDMVVAVRSVVYSLSVRLSLQILRETTEIDQY